MAYFTGGGATPSMSDFSSMSFDQMSQHMAPLGTGQRGMRDSWRPAPSASARRRRLDPAAPQQSSRSYMYSSRSTSIRGRRGEASGARYLDDDPDIVAALGSAMEMSSAAAAAHHQPRGAVRHRAGNDTNNNDGNDYEELLALDEGVQKRGVSQRERLRLSVYPASRKDTRDGDGSPASCLICCERIRERAPLLRMPCGHVFHEACVSRWLDEHRTCPTCRKEIPG